MTALDISFVIPFKDWGTRRLKLAASTALAALGSVSGEVIVSDYGSRMTADEVDGLRREMEALGAVYVRTETNGIWSRSRALNAGFARSRGRIFVASDADMLTPPGCLEDTARIILGSPSTAVYYTCIDLPPEWDDGSVEQHGIDWALLRSVGTRRPRWGMGLNAVSRETFDAVRGWDERFQIYGGEDNDFSARIRRAGTRVVWPTSDSFALLHMWHPSTAATHEKSPAEAHQITRNKWIARYDPTYSRNTTEWAHQLANARPLVSVVIATHNRRELLMETVASVLAQSMQDFEIVIIDDGSTDGTDEQVAAIQDPRVRYVRQANAGIAAARNRGSDEARGHWIAVLDDDDLMLPWRLEVQVASLTAGVDASFGAFCNFDDTSGEMKLYATREMTLETANVRGGAPGHSTWLVRADLMRKVRYDETLTSGVDNDLALRLLRTGAVWRHTGRVLVLRRVHAHQVTVTDGTAQAGAASSALNRLQFRASRDRLAELVEAHTRGSWVPIEEAANLETALSPYLPDHLVQRSRLKRLELSSGTRRRCRIVISRPDGTKEALVEEPTTWDDMAALGKDLTGTFIYARRLSKARLGGERDRTDISDALRVEIERLLRHELERASREGVLVPVAQLRDGLAADAPSIEADHGAPQSVVTSPLMRGGRLSPQVRQWVESANQPLTCRENDINELREAWLRWVGQGDSE